MTNTKNQQKYRSKNAQLFLSPLHIITNQIFLCKFVQWVGAFSFYNIKINRNMIKLKEGFSGERALVLPISILREMETDVVASLLYITDIGYYPKALYHFRERTEPIDQYVLIYCVDGEGWYRLRNREHKITPNQYFVLPAGEPHAYGANMENPWTIYWIHFKGKLASEFAHQAASPIGVRPSVHSRISDRIDMFEEIYHTLKMGYGRENLLYACSVFHHYLGTLRYMQQYRDVVSEYDKQVDIVTAAIHYMQENIEKKLSLSEIARHIGYSSSYFSVLFSQRTGSSPLAYFNQLKIQKACQLLDFTDMKINQICYKVGIADNYYFSRLFHKIMGISPMEYKKLKKDKQWCVGMFMCLTYRILPILSSSRKEMA